MRASLDKDGLYCLAFAEHLDYEMSKQLFQFLQTMMKEGLCQIIILTDINN